MKTTKKVLTLLLSVAIMISFMPVAAFADGEIEGEQPNEEIDFDIDRSTLNADKGNKYRAFIGVDPLTDEPVADEASFSIDMGKLANSGIASGDAGNYELKDGYSIIWQAGIWNEDFSEFNSGAVLASGDCLATGPNLNLTSDQILEA